MSNEQYQFLNARHWPARLDKEKLCWVINCEEHEIAPLMRARLIEPLGDPAQNGRKYFATKTITEACQDLKWLNKVTECIRKNTKDRNSEDDDSHGDDGARLAA